MSRLALWLLLAVGLVGCSARSVVVKSEEVPQFNDSQWVIQSEPRPRAR